MNDGMNDYMELLDRIGEIPKNPEEALQGLYY